jgi:hypothetical protein
LNLLTLRPYGIPRAKKELDNSNAPNEKLYILYILNLFENFYAIYKDPLNRKVNAKHPDKWFPLEYFIYLIVRFKKIIFLINLRGSFLKKIGIMPTFESEPFRI